jgi:hypothetical protein
MMGKYRNVKRRITGKYLHKNQTIAEKYRQSTAEKGEIPAYQPENDTKVPTINRRMKEEGSEMTTAE